MVDDDENGNAAQSENFSLPARPASTENNPPPIATENSHHSQSIITPDQPPLTKLPTKAPRSMIHEPPKPLPNHLALDPNSASLHKATEDGLHPYSYWAAKKQQPVFSKFLSQHQRPRTPPDVTYYPDCLSQESRLERPGSARDSISDPSPNFITDASSSISLLPEGFPLAGEPKDLNPFGPITLSGYRFSTYTEFSAAPTTTPIQTSASVLEAQLPTSRPTAQQFLPSGDVCRNTSQSHGSASPDFSSDHAPSVPTISSTCRTPDIPNSESVPIAASKGFACDKCNRTFSRRHELNRHMKYHSKMHKCSECLASFSLNKDLSRHSAAVHQTSSKYFCPIKDCKYSERTLGTQLGFMRKDNWRRHVKTHSKEHDKLDS